MCTPCCRTPQNYRTNLILAPFATHTHRTTPLIRRIYPSKAKLWDAVIQATAAGVLQQQQEQRAARLRTLSMDRRGAAAAAAAGEEAGAVAAAGTVVGSSLGVLVPSYDPEKIIAGLYLLMPSRVTVGTFTDAASTAAVLGERVGAVRDPNAREILLAARLFGAEAVARQVLAPSSASDVGPQLLELLQPDSAVMTTTGAGPCPFDFVLLPWPLPGEEGSVDFEQSMYGALERTAASFLLLRDRGLPLPRIGTGPTPCARFFTIGVLLCDHQRREGSLLEVTALLLARKDVQLHLLVYRGMTPQTAELLRALKLGAPLSIAASEDDLLSLVASIPFDLLVYSDETTATGPQSQGRRHTRAGSGVSAPTEVPNTTMGRRGSLNSSRGLEGLRLFGPDHRRTSSSSSSAAAAARALDGSRGGDGGGSGGSTSCNNGTQPLLQDAHAPDGGGGNGGGERTAAGSGSGGGVLPTYRAMDPTGAAMTPLGEGYESHVSHQQPTPRALVERLCDRLEGVHGKPLSIMEVHGGQAGESIAPLPWMTTTILREEEEENEEGGRGRWDAAAAAATEEGGGLHA